MSSNVLVTPDRLRAFFHPTNVALVGATDNSRWSISTYSNLKLTNFPGNVYCVNPNREVVHGQRAYRSLLDIEAPVDLAYVMVSTSQVLRVMEEAHQKDIHNLILLTSGFREVGADGEQLEQQVLEYAAQHDQVILGPNGNGFVNYTAQLTPYGLPLLPPLNAGPVGVVLQSGALASSVMALAQARNVGLSLLVSMGNETVMTATDVVDYLIEDDATKVIALFLETIRSPREFARIARKALAHGKPIVAMKIGRSAQSARTAMAHTGALVGNDAVNDAVMRQLGVIRVESLEDLITTAGLLGYTPPLSGRRMGVVTPSGGACDILSDRAEEEGIDIPEFSPETIERLKAVVPNFSTVHNPLDVTGYVVVDRTLLLRALEVVTDDESLDFILCLTEPPRVAPDDPTPVYEQFKWLSTTIQASAKPVVLVTNTGIDISAFGRTVSYHAGLHFVGGMEHGMTALGRALWWYEKQAKQAHAGSSQAEERKPLSGTKHEAVGTWSEHQARTFLGEHGIPVVPGALATTADAAVQAAREIGFPVALKVQSAAIPHKSDVGGVLLGLKSDEEVRNGYTGILSNIERLAPNTEVDGILVSPMRSGGTELLVGIVKDAVWGHVLAVGLGGILVEVLNDSSLRVLPVTRTDVHEMLDELRGKAILQGTRGRTAADLEQVVDVIYHTTQVALACGEALQALEINPLWVHGSHVEALDALITWTPSST